MDGEHLTVPEAAQFLRLSTSTLNRYRVYGCGPKFRKLGRRVIYRREDLVDWVARKGCTTTSQYGE